VDKADTQTVVSELTSVGGKLLTFGWIVKLWPFLQAGWGELPDVIQNMLTDGGSSLISLRLRGTAGPSPSPDSVTALTPSVGFSTTSGIVNANGAYWFAAATQTSTGQVPFVTVTVYRWDGSAWQRQATVPIRNGDGSLASGGLSRSEPITVRSLTGSATPDFLVNSQGADTNWLNVVSDATGQWKPVPFDDSGGLTFGENEIGISGTTITIGYDSCLPNCASGHVTKVSFRYGNGAFAPVDAPGSCTGEALAQSAHAAAPSAPAGSNSITGFACAGGYAAATATNGNYGWTITFRSTGSGWTQLGSGNIMPTTGMPSSVYQTLKGKIQSQPQNEYYPY
jgi:hypothetical protein